MKSPANPYFYGPTLDDVMRSVTERILDSGNPVVATKGSTVEIAGVLLEIKDPRARLSRTESRGKPFSCLGELCWYLAGSGDLAFISYYLSKYEESADDGSLFGAYGPRLFDWDGANQVQNVISHLQRKATTRQAVIQIFDRGDIVGDHKDVACTCTLQFMIREDALHLIASMRSNDAYWGMPHDIFCFTMLQEIIASELSIALGSYKHAVGSLHIYDDRIDAARQFVDEGWQSTLTPMPPMPSGSQWPAVTLLLEAEATIREKGTVDPGVLAKLDPYWADLVRLLQIFRLKKEKSTNGFHEIHNGFSSDVYDPFISSLYQ